MKLLPACMLAAALSASVFTFEGWQTLRGISRAIEKTSFLHMDPDFQTQWVSNGLTITVSTYCSNYPPTPLPEGVTSCEEWHEYKVAAQVARHPPDTES